MLDIGFSELLLIGGVALVVLGPEKLAVVARTTGKWAGKAQNYVNDVKADIAREGELAELRKLKSELESTGHDIENSIRNTSQTLATDLSDIRQDVQSAATQDENNHALVQASLDSTSNYTPPHIALQASVNASSPDIYTPPDTHDTIAMQMELEQFSESISHMEARLQQLKQQLQLIEHNTTTAVKQSAV